jgi:hypothetical protein
MDEEEEGGRDLQPPEMTAGSVGRAEAAMSHQQLDLG